MKKKSNGSIYIMVFLIIVCVVCGIIGLLESKKEDTITNNPDNNENKVPEEYKVSYRYYLDGTEINTPLLQEYIEIPSTEPTGTPIKQEVYKFDKYTCTNNVNGEWNNEKWEFTPNLTANTTCRLYFVKTSHTVTFKANNGILPSKQEIENVASKENSATLNILPNEGYKYDKVECTNGATALYDDTTKDLKVTNVTKDSVCTISFKINDYTTEVRASNGTVSGEGKSANYGESTTYIVTPAENYTFDSVTCTNNQNATYDVATNTLTIASITNSTICNIQFKPVKFTVSLTIENGTLLTSSSSPQTVSEGKTVTFGISPNNGFGLTGAQLSCDVPNIKIEAQAGTVIIYNVQSNLNCKAILKATTPSE